MIYRFRVKLKLNRAN